MSEKIYLRVPSKVAHEYVSQGNLSVQLEPGEVVTVDDRRFADWLVREYALAEVDKPGSRKKGTSKPRAAKPRPEKATARPVTPSADTPATPPIVGGESANEAGGSN